MEIKRATFLPGDKPISVDAMIRVNHSGEYGAQKIYAGQIRAVKHLKKLFKQKNYDDLSKVLQEMHDGEVLHYQYFKELMNKVKARPSLLLPLWSVLGYTMGYVTGFLGQKVAMTYTVGVESVIGNHYAEQLSDIQLIQPQDNPLLKDLSNRIEQFMHEELEHLNTGVDWEATAMCGHFYFNTLVKFMTKIMIYIAKVI